MFSFCRRSKPSNVQTEMTVLIAAPQKTWTERAYACCPSMETPPRALLAGFILSVAGIITGAVGAITQNISARNATISFVKAGFSLPSLPGLIDPTRPKFERCKRAIHISLLTVAAIVPWGSLGKKYPALSTVLTILIPPLVASSTPNFPRSSTYAIYCLSALELAVGIYSLNQIETEKIDDSLSTANALISLAFAPLAFGHFSMTPTHFIKLSLENKINFLCMLMTTGFSLGSLSKKAPPVLVDLALTTIVCAAAALNLHLIKQTKAPRMIPDDTKIPTNILTTSIDKNESPSLPAST
ncbi:MAG: hypothetical protein NTV32_00505 [Gammaproteobacteria bacterium]|nr:hypothetical protein [Gammaproteobacteria bacterium]